MWPTDWKLYVGALLGGYALYRFFRKPAVGGSLRIEALRVSLAEDARWGDRVPDTARVDQYLRGVDPHGKSLAQENTDTNRINFCAAAVGWAEHQTGLGDLPPWRSGAKQIMNDCISGLRGESRWHPAFELRQGWRPPRGALAIYTRGDPSAFLGHVDRVVSVRQEGYEAVGANEGGRKWTIDLTRYTTQALLGFVVDGEKPEEGRGEMLFRSEIPEDFVEPLLTEEERTFIRGWSST